MQPLLHDVAPSSWCSVAIRNASTRAHGRCCPPVAARVLHGSVLVLASLTAFNRGLLRSCFVIFDTIHRTLDSSLTSCDNSNVY